MTSADTARSEDDSADFSTTLYAALRKREFVVALGILLIFSAVLATLKVLRIEERQGDTARYFETVENIADGKGPVSGIDAGYNSPSITTLLGDQVGTGPLPGTHSTGELNFLRYHAYYILYLIAPLVKFLRTDVVLLTLDVLSYTGLIFLVYLGLRAKAIPIAAACLFLLLVISHPAWSEGLLLGQFYPDRFFLLAGFLFIYLASRADTKRWSLLLAGVLCALIHERASLIAGIVLLLYTVMYWREDRSHRKLKLGLAAGLMFFAVFSAKFVLTAQGQYGGYLPAGLADLIARFHDPVFANKTEVFLIVNVALLLVALFDWRSAAIAAVTMVPSVVGSVGGAEKVGWSIHYQAFYFPILVWAAMRGFIVAYRLATTQKLVPLFYPAVFVLVIFLSSIDPYSALLKAPGGRGCTVFPAGGDAATLCPSDPHPSIRVSNIKQNNFLFKFYKMAQQSLNRGGLQFYELGNRISNAIPANAVVSSIEPGMPYVYQNRRVLVFPEGIDQADFAVIALAAPTDTSEADFRNDENWTGEPQSKRPRHFPAAAPGQPIYADPATKTLYGGVFFAIAPPRQLHLINEAIVHRMARDGYDFERPKILPGLGIVVLKRRHSAHYAQSQHS